MLANLGTAHLEADLLTPAIGYYRQAVEHAEHNGDPRWLSYATRGLGEAHRRNGDLEIARDLLLNALQDAKARHDELSEANALQRLGRIYSELDHNADAQTCLVQGLALARRIGQARLEGVISYDIGNACIRTGQWKDARDSLEQAVAILSRAGVTILARRAKDRLDFLAAQQADL